MAYIQQQQAAQSNSLPKTEQVDGGDQSETMSATYEVPMGASSSSSVEAVGLHPESTDPTINHQQHQQIHQHQQQQQATISGVGEAGDSNNHQHQQSSSTASNPGDRQDNNSSDRPSLLLDTGGGCSTKTPNSYKFPLLKRYFEFGPWVGRNRKAVCLACHMQSSSSQPDRLLKHLNRCNGLSEEDKQVVCDLMNDRTANKRKKPGTLKRPEMDDDTSYYGEDDIEDVSSNNASHNSINISGGALRKPRRDHPDKSSQIDEALTRWIMVCKIPLKTLHSREFIEFVHALNPDYHLPSKEKITNVLIPRLLNII